MEFTKTCITCLYCQKHPREVGQGFCQRFPPTVSAVTVPGPTRNSLQIQTITSYPKVTLKEHTCAEYVRKEPTNGG